MKRHEIYLFSISSHRDAISVNSLDITFFKPSIDFSQYDFLIITSKQACEALKQYDFKEYKDKKALCISKASAKSFETLGGTVLDVGKGYGDTLIQKIETYPKTKKWLYLRAKVVASDFVELSQKNGYSIDEIVVYESQCSEAIQNIQVPQNATLIFTSPSSIECFLKNHTFYTTQKIIVIGKTTANRLPNGVKYTLSKETTIQSCIDLSR